MKRYRGEVAEKTRGFRSVGLDHPSWYIRCRACHRAWKNADEELRHHPHARQYVKLHVLRHLGFSFPPRPPRHSPRALPGSLKRGAHGLQITRLH